MAKTAIFLIFLMLGSLMVLSINANPLVEDDPCICATTDDLNWVCGNDGVSYPNLSTLECENECKKLNIEMKSVGKC